MHIEFKVMLPNQYARTRSQALPVRSFSDQSESALKASLSSLSDWSEYEARILYIY